METIKFTEALIRGRQSKRGFLSRPVPIETVREILPIAKYVTGWTPSEMLPRCAHGLTDTHGGRFNADLLAFIRS